MGNMQAGHVVWVITAGVALLPPTEWHPPQLRNWDPLRRKESILTRMK